MADRLFELSDLLEEVLVERCVELLEQTEAIREFTNYHWWPEEASVMTFQELCSPGFGITSPGRFRRVSCSGAPGAGIV